MYITGTQAAIVTGANGFIGARVVLRLLKQGWRVQAIGRGKDERTWADRVFAALEGIDGRRIDEGLIGRFDCREADLLAPGLDLCESPQSVFADSKPILIHVAGDTRFTPKNPETQRRINVDGSVNVIRALAPILSRVVHVSTAYVCGRRGGVIREDECEYGQAFRNPYEESKLAAEIAVRGLCAELGLPLVIARPSIVTNDTQTGRSSTFTHLNALIEVVNRIQEYYGIEDGEVVSKAIRLAVDPCGRSNLVQVDPLIEALLKIALDPRSPGRAFHLCHPSPQTNREIVELIAEAIGIKDKLALSYVDELAAPVSYTEKMIMRSLKVYLTYMNARTVFDLSNTKEIVPDYDKMFPPIDREYIDRVMEFERRTRRAEAN